MTGSRIVLSKKDKKSYKKQQKLLKKQVEKENKQRIKQFKQELYASSQDKIEKESEELKRSYSLNYISHNKGVKNPPSESNSSMGNYTEPQKKWSTQTAESNSINNTDVPGRNSSSQKITISGTEAAAKILSTDLDLKASDFNNDNISSALTNSSHSQAEIIQPEPQKKNVTIQEGLKVTQDSAEYLEQQKRRGQKAMDDIRQSMHSTHKPHPIVRTDTQFIKPPHNPLDKLQKPKKSSCLTSCCCFFPQPRLNYIPREESYDYGTMNKNSLSNSS